MKNRTVIFGYSLLLSVFVIACSKPIQPTYLGYQNLRFGKVGTKSNVLMSDIKFYNPNKYALNVKQADMDVYFNDRLLGHTSMNEMVSLPPLDTTLIPFTIEASATDLLANAAQIYLNPNVKIRVQGNAKAGRGGVFVNIPINYQGTQRISLSRTDTTMKR
ncbi:MAG: LEA type 2 family protein [Arcicella sp.]|nr:LEA type 2 family protein [Arcicella sp.]